MFGHKENNPAPVPSDIKVVTMPTDFYGGKDPAVKFKAVEKTVDMAKFEEGGVKASEKRALDKATVAGGESPVHPANILTSKKFIIMAGIGLFIIFCLAVGGYYWWQGKKTTAENVPPPVAVVQPVIPTTSAPEIVPTTTEEVAPTTTEAIPAIKETAIEFPSMLLGESPDFDNDKISDVAEEIFGTDSTNPDTDGDKYPDGHELFYLYNPNGFEPKKLLDSGLVKQFQNPSFNYALYYPANWALGLVDTEGRQVLFSTLTGENIEVRTFDLSPGETLVDWLAINAPTERLADLVDFTGRFATLGKMRKDGLVYYFISNNRLYALVYHTTNSNVVNYKIVLEIMARSFQTDVPPETVATPATTVVFPEAVTPTATASADVESGTTTESMATPTPEGEMPLF
ncbi:MAG: hypothetical protein PHD72_02315 [Patescibacteria group bacterium]|nr:hypothetical protein [Patescibacteria group bacterium]